MRTAKTVMKEGRQGQGVRRVGCETMKQKKKRRLQTTKAATETFSRTRIPNRFEACYPRAGKHVVTTSGVAAAGRLAEVDQVDDAEGRPS